MKKSIVQSEKECYVCGRVTQLHRHHILFGTANRKVAEKHGLTVYLCLEHHEGNTGVHHNKELDLELKRLAQRKFELTHTRQQWMDAVGRNYL